MRTFLELDPAEFAGRVVIVDVDGTLVPDGGGELADGVAEKVRALGAAAHVYLCSNALPERTRRFAELCGARFLDTPHRKPSRRAVERLEHEGKPLTVVGDKALTDGLLAANIGASFVRVARISGEGGFVARAAYALDDAFHPVYRLIEPLAPYITLMRPTQWVKNLLTFAPLLFAGDFFNSAFFLKSLAAAAVFSLLASALYAFNDVRDAHEDRNHPTKRFRAVARGHVSEGAAYALAFVLATLALGVSAFIPGILPAAAAYVVLNASYSLFLKRIPVLDVLGVSLSYVLRVIGGGAAAGIFVSIWIELCVFFGALTMVTGKRLAEFSRAAKRSVLKRYSKPVLHTLLFGAALSAVASYGLYSVLGARSPLVVFSVPLVATAIARLAYRIFEGRDAEYPELLAFKDPWILGLTALWVAFMFFVLYLR